jgi:hypothetical protein
LGFIKGFTPEGNGFLYSGETRTGGFVEGFFVPFLDVFLDGIVFYVDVW